VNAFFGDGYVRILRILLLAKAIILPATVLGIWLDPQILPDDLKKYVLIEEGDELLTAIIIALLVGIYLVPIIGLWLLKRWARVFYTGLIILGVAIGLFPEPVVHSAYTSLLLDADSMLNGGILLLIWLIMKDEFASGAARSRVTPS